MPALTSYTHALTSSQAAKLRTLLEGRGWEFQAKPYCLYAAAKGKVNISVYEKGPKIVVQGKETEEFVTLLLEPEVLGEAKLGYEEVHHPEMFQPHIGVDESGKGDLFGPLVIAGVYVDGEVAHRLREIGAVDSKRISSDERIFKIASDIRRIPGLAWEVIAINPERYNELYTKFGNLNRLLAWGHAKVIETLLTRVPGCQRAISDQFANPAVLQRALQTRGREIELVQRTKAESDPAVAAASILAREAFVRWLNDQTHKWGVTFYKGVSENVKQSAVSLVQMHGREVLPTLCKMHFRTSSEILSGIVSDSPK
ncbi:ribonuclease HIII [Prosthecobacter vanneervenii]|uniref:Ribonuclease n=1 Tax=Prosthecobacter vanneervenii TaxID=48466 RepID=A0A7W7YDV5_9BACT|nr:ribonuclease HIII [Prosthecobacter vanneervenii]MBB5034372.1 ribonuclease HIII [Prosthecobacter vanneervenii]